MLRLEFGRPRLAEEDVQGLVAVLDPGVVGHVDDEADLPDPGIDLHGLGDRLLGDLRA